MPAKLDYVDLIEQARSKAGLSVRELAARAGLSASRLGTVLRREGHLSREQAFYVGMALRLSEVQMEQLALLVVYARAEGKEFKKHILGKLEKVSKLGGDFDWSRYIEAAIKRK